MVQLGERVAEMVRRLRWRSSGASIRTIAFGVIFGVAVILFLLMWLFRGRGEEGGPEALFATQGAPVETGIAAPAPPAPLVDPFGNAPVDLKPSGPIPSRAG